jgi:hypothetical protein
MTPPDDQIALRLSRRQIMIITAALARYAEHWERHSAEDSYETHPAEQLEEVRQDIGELLWDLEEALTPTRTRLDHSERARPPGSRE